jgi:hypothetical protein
MGLFRPVTGQLMRRTKLAQRFFTSLSRTKFQADEMKCRSDVTTSRFYDNSTTWVKEIKTKESKRIRLRNLPRQNQKVAECLHGKIKEENCMSEEIRCNIRNSLIHIAGVKQKFCYCQKYKKIFSEDDPKLRSQMEVR